MEPLKKSYTYHELTSKNLNPRFERYLNLAKRCGAGGYIQPNMSVNLFLSSEFSSEDKIRNWLTAELGESPYDTYRHTWCKPKVEKWHEVEVANDIDEDLPTRIECYIWQKDTGQYSRHHERTLKGIEAFWSHKRSCGPYMVSLASDRKVGKTQYRSKAGKTQDSFEYTRDYEITHLKPYNHHKVVKADREFLLSWIQHFIEPF